MRTLYPSIDHFVQSADLIVRIQRPAVVQFQLFDQTGRDRLQCERLAVVSRGATLVFLFGWKDQHASLESFAADAYLNEMVITSPLFPEENSSGGREVTQYDTVPDPEDDGVMSEFLHLPTREARKQGAFNPPCRVYGEP
jgi:CxxC motif-containing protein (DUF1111 family)